MSPTPTFTRRVSSPSSGVWTSPGFFRRRLGSWGAAATLSLSVCATACGSSQPAAALASGERPVTGEPRYDKFFAEIGAMLAAVREGEQEEADVRGALARRVGIPDAATADILGERLRERTARLAAEGLTLELEFTGIDDIDDRELGMAKPEPVAGEAEEPSPVARDPEEDPPEEGAPVAPTATLRTPGREPEPRELRLLKVLAQAALSGATLYADMGVIRRRATDLLGEVTELRASLPSAFPDLGQRDNVRGKLAEAEALLPDVGNRARALSNSADLLIALLDEAANTAAVPPPNRRRAREARENAAPDGGGRGRVPREAPPSTERPARRAAPSGSEPNAPAPERPPADFEP